VFIVALIVYCCSDKLFFFAIEIFNWLSLLCMYVNGSAYIYKIQSFKINNNKKKMNMAVKKFGSSNSSFDSGKILSVRDAVVLIKGLDSVGVNEMIIIFPKNPFKAIINKKLQMQGVVLNLERGLVKALAFVPDYKIKKGLSVLPTGKLIGFTVDIHLLLGRVINPLSIAIDGRAIGSQKKVASNKNKSNNDYFDIDVKAAGIMERRKVIEPVVTGIKMIDMLVPIGRGQRELIIGDKKNR